MVHLVLTEVAEPAGPAGGAGAGAADVVAARAVLTQTLLLTVQTVETPRTR